MRFLLVVCIALASYSEIGVAGPTYRIEDDPSYGQYYQGDMRFPEGFDIKNGIIGSGYRWPGNTIPYSLASSFTNDEINLIRGALAEISSKTCIRFVERSNEADYVFVTREGTGCWSYVGRIRGRQELNLQPNTGGGHCLWHGIVAHEFIHAIGFFHEQSRLDRDDYVTIMWDNIQSGTEGNFETTNSDAQNVGYDYGSVMHYGATAFAIDPSRPTIVPKQNVEIGQRNGLSASDALKINRMYSC